MHQCFFSVGFEGQLPIFFWVGMWWLGDVGEHKKTSTINNNSNNSSKISSLQLSQANKTPPSERIPTTPRFSRYHKLPELFNQRAQLDQQRRSNEAMEAEESRRQQRKLREEKEKEREKADDEERQRNVCWEFAGV